MEEHEWICECFSCDCSLTVFLTKEEVERIYALDVIVIAKGCSQGAEKGYVLVESHAEYDFYWNYV